MQRAPFQGSKALIQTLFEAGAVSSLSDAELLDRFLTAGDGLVFEAIVNRHGPLVLKVCRSLLKNPSDLEDVFQAVFLVLVRKAHSIRGKESLAPWLYRVGRRIAVEANSQTLQRQRREVARASRAEVHDQPKPWSDSIPVLLEEIDRLPGKYRSAIVLCELEERTHQEVATELGVQLNTVSTRVSRARKLLRSRLVRRGVAPAVFAELWSSSLQAVQTPSGWSNMAARTAKCALLGSREGSEPSAALAQRVLASLLFIQLKLTAGVVLGLAIVVGASFAALHSTCAEKEAPASAVVIQEMKKPKKQESVDQTGSEMVQYWVKVLDPNGKPLPSASVALAFDVADAWGRPPALFSKQIDSRIGQGFTFPRAQLARSESEALEAAPLQFVATAPGFAPAWHKISASDGVRSLTFQLVEDSVSIEGRLIDLEGRPVEGATIEARWILDPKPNLERWLAMNGKRAMVEEAEEEFLKMGYMPNSLSPKVKSDANGRFTLNGIGKDRGAFLVIKHPLHSTEYAVAIARSGLGLKGATYNFGGAGIPLVDAKPTLSLSKCSFAEGTVRDRDTKKPIKNVHVTLYVGFPLHKTEVQTDSEGRYRLTGLPTTGPFVRFGNYSIAAVAEEDLAYFSDYKGVEPKPPGETVRLDFELTRGVWVEGKAVEKGTNKPVFAELGYYAFKDNPLAAQVRSLEISPRQNTFLSLTARSKPDGTFRILALPGPGLIAARAPLGSYRRLGVPADVDLKKVSAPQLQLIFNRFYHQGIRIDANSTGEATKVAFEFEPERMISGRILDPEGKPSSGVMLFGSDRKWSTSPLGSSEFSIVARTDGKKANLLFLQAERHLGSMLTVEPEARGPLEVKLEKTAAIKGRLVDELGNPRPNVPFTIFFRSDPKSELFDIDEYSPPRSETGPDGRFQLDNLVPGVRFGIVLIESANNVKKVFIISPDDKNEWSLAPEKPAIGESSASDSSISSPKPRRDQAKFLVRRFVAVAAQRLPS